MDIAPVNPGHLLVVPRAHAASLADLDENTGAHVFVVATRMAAALRRSGLRCEGVNLFLADGEAAFQDVFHVHLHVLPRWRGDSFRIDLGPAPRPEREELDGTAAAVRTAYERLFG
jgi:diadenosine tetraphosphate (Ap4A) HIT family hydrolase